MPLVTFTVYRVVTGDSTFENIGDFTVEAAGTITVLESNGIDDLGLGDATDTGSSDVDDQIVYASTVPEYSPGDIIDSRYAYPITGSDGSTGDIYGIAPNRTTDYGELYVSREPLDPNVTYTFGSYTRDGYFVYSEVDGYAFTPCFTRGTFIETEDGAVEVQDLSVGQKVLTKDRGYQKIRWIGCKALDRRALESNPKLLPIRIERGALGADLPARDLLVSPQHRMFVSSKIVERMFDEQEVLVPAKKLTEIDGISVETDCTEVEYYHILFDQHEIVYAEAAPTESLLLGEMVKDVMPQETLEELNTLFPDLIAAYSAEAPEARTIVERGKFTKKLVYRHIKNNKPLLRAEDGLQAAACH